MGKMKLFKRIEYYPFGEDTHTSRHYWEYFGFEPPGRLKSRRAFFFFKSFARLILLGFTWDAKMEIFNGKGRRLYP